MCVYYTLALNNLTSFLFSRRSSITSFSNDPSGAIIGPSVKSITFKQNKKTFKNHDIMKLAEKPSFYKLLNKVSLKMPIGFN